MGPGSNRSGRRVIHNGRAIAARQQQPALERDGRDGNDAVAAHRAVALVVHEQHARVRAWRHGLGEDRAVHVGVPARLEHQRPAQMIGVPLQPLALVEHRLAARRREPLDDEPQRLAGRVGVDGFQTNHLP